MGVQCQTRFNTLINGAITSIQTTTTLDAAPAQTTGYGTIERGNANEEDTYWAGLAGLQLTGMLRGLSRTALTNTEVVGNQYAHVDNSAFEGTLLHYIVNNKVDVDDNEAITGSWTFNTQLPTSTDTPGANAELTTKLYVDTADNLKGNLSGGNTWAGVQVFANDNARSTTNAAPVTATAFTNKQYVDDQIATTANNRVAVSSNDTTPGFLLGKLTGNTHITFTEINDAGDEDLRINTDAVQSTTGVANANQIIATDANGRLDSTFLSSPAPIISLTALEAVTAGNAVALLPNEVQWYSQLTEAAIALGDANARGRYAIRFTPTVTVATLTNLNIRARIVGAGQDMTVRIETDNVGAPSGTLADADATDTVTAAEMGAAFATEVVTWAGNVSLVAGSTYWLVFTSAGINAAAYIELSVNSSHDENYVTYTRSTYDVFAGTWGNNVTNATPFFWGNTENVPFGAGVVPTDANWGARTWNFVGFARTTVAANAAVDVYYDIVPNQTNLSFGQLYYISATAGATTTTAPASTYDNGTEPTIFTYRVGRAIATTTLKIERGQKRVLIRETTAISATTTRQYIVWFKPEYVRVNGSGDNAGGNDAAMSAGYITADGTDASIGIAANNAAAKNGQGNTSASLDTAVNDANSFAGAGSALSDAGFTYTYTETGAANMFAILEAVQ